MTQANHFIWYELMTADAPAAKSFYDSVIGWNIGSENSMPDEAGPDAGDYRMIARSDGGFAGGVLVLTQAMQDGGAKPGWFGYVHHADVDGAAERMVAAGGQVWIAPHDMPGVGRMAFLADPQGAPIYLMDPAPPPGQEDAQSDVFSVDKAQHCRWNQLQTTDPQAALSLYGEVFGWHRSGGMPMGAMGEYTFVNAGETGIGAIMPLMDDVAHPVWSYFFGVDDIDRAVAAVEAGGGTLDSPIQQIPGGEYSCHCFDPEGCGFGLVGPRKE